MAISYHHPFPILHFLTEAFFNQFYLITYQTIVKNQTISTKEDFVVYKLFNIYYVKVIGDSLRQ